MSRVLIADDDQTSCKLLSGLLAKWGYQSEIVHNESMQSCGVITLRPQPEAAPRLAENLGAKGEMHFPRCHSAHECGRRGNSGRCAGSISSVASSPFVLPRCR